MAADVLTALSDFEQTILWESLIGAETRAQYFADLVQTLRARQRLLTIGSLVLSSGAALTLLSSAFPPQYNWVKPTLALFAALLSATSLVSSNEKNSIEAADLHYRWNRLALSYQQLWADMYAETASQTLASLNEKEAEVSKSSTSMPNIPTLMLKAEKNVAMHHGLHLAA